MTSQRFLHPSARGRARVLAAAALAVGLTLAGCGDGGGDDGGAVGPDSDVPAQYSDAAKTAADKGLRFAGGHDQIVEKAKQEGAFTIIWSLGADYEEHKEILDSFFAKYPFLKDKVTVENLDGVEARQRFMLEADAGALQDYGVLYAATEVYGESADMCDWDVYGMAEAGILDIPLKMIDPNRRTVVAAGSTAGILAYNKSKFTEAQLPNTWEELLDPAKYGTGAGVRTLGDVRIATYSAMVPEWGIDKAKQYYADFAQQLKPTWVQRFAPAVLQLSQGEFDLFPFINYSSVEQRKDEAPNVGVKFIEPVPVRISETHCVLKDQYNSAPYSSLLWLEWSASPQGQAVMEDPTVTVLQSSIYADVPNGLGAQLKGKKLSVSDWSYFEDQSKSIQDIIGAAGFPKATDSN